MPRKSFLKCAKNGGFTYIYKNSHVNALIFLISKNPLYISIFSGPNHYISRTIKNPSKKKNTFPIHHLASPSPMHHQPLISPKHTPATKKRIPIFPTSYLEPPSAISPSGTSPTNRHDPGGSDATRTIGRRRLRLLASLEEIAATA